MDLGLWLEVTCITGTYLTVIALRWWETLGLWRSVFSVPGTGAGLGPWAAPKGTG
jgi:hypothetical protein